MVPRVAGGGGAGGALARKGTEGDSLSGLYLHKAVAYTCVYICQNPPNYTLKMGVFHDV